MPSAHTIPFAPWSWLRTVGSYFPKSLQMIKFTPGSLAAHTAGTGRRLKIAILEILLEVRKAWRMPSPTIPVAPVRIRCMVSCIVRILLYTFSDWWKSITCPSGREYCAVECHPVIFRSRPVDDGEETVRAGAVSDSSRLLRSRSSASVQSR